MSDPTLKDIDSMFAAFQDKLESEKLNKAAWKLVKVAKDSKPFMDAVEGFFRATMGGVSLAGVQFGPVAMTLMIGWVMSRQWAERAGAAPADDSLIIDQYLKALEKSEEKDEKGNK